MTEFFVLDTDKLNKEEFRFKKEKKSKQRINRDGDLWQKYKVWILMTLGKLQNYEFDGKEVNVGPLVKLNNLKFINNDVDVVKIERVHNSNVSKKNIEKLIDSDVLKFMENSAVVIFPLRRSLMKAIFKRNVNWEEEADIKNLVEKGLLCFEGKTGKTINSGILLEQVVMECRERKWVSWNVGFVHVIKYQCIFIFLFF
jgi:hypothetical protein